MSLLLTPKTRSFLNEAETTIGFFVCEDEKQEIATLKIITSILKNVVNHPHELKFRTIKLNNPKLVENVIKREGALDILLLAGFRKKHDVITLPQDVRESNLKLLIDVLEKRINGPSRAERLKQEMERKKRQQELAEQQKKRKAEKEALRKKLQQDKAERKNRPPEKASKAVPRGTHRLSDVQRFSDKYKTNE